MVKLDLDDSISNTWVRLTEARHVALQATDERAEVLFPGLVRFILGENGTPRLLGIQPPT